MVNHHALPSAPKIVSDLSALAYHGMIGNTIQSLIENGSDFFKINLDFYVFIKKIPYTSGLNKRILTSPITYLKINLSRVYSSFRVVLYEYQNHY